MNHEAYRIAEGAYVRQRRGYLIGGAASHNSLASLGKLDKAVFDAVRGAATIDEILSRVAAEDHARYIDQGQVLTSLKALQSAGLIQGGDEPRRPVPGRPNRELFSHLLLEMTWDCNLRCRHCYMNGGAKRPLLLRRDVLADQIVQFADLGGTSVTLSGGEPLLYPGWETLAEVAHRADLTQALMTNGTYLDARRFSIVRALGMGVGLGLDGARAETHDRIRGRGSFDQAMAALKLMERSGYNDNITICFTPTGQNVYDLPAVMSMMASRGLPRLYVSLLEERGRAQSGWASLSLSPVQKEWMLRELYEASLTYLDVLRIEVTHHTDIFARLVYGVDSQRGDQRRHTVRVASEGEVFLSAYLGAPEHSVGRVGERPLDELLDGPRATRVIESWSNRTETIPKCRECAYAGLCKAGSAVLAYSSAGTFDEPDAFCDARIGLFDAVLLPSQPT